jgi:CBS-domain-containing membrane protein
MLTAKDILKPNVLTIRDNAPIFEVVRFLHENGISGAPVVDDVGKMVGIVSQSDLIKLTTVAAKAERDEEREAAKYESATASKHMGFLQQILSPLYIARWGAQAARLDREEEESQLLRTKTVGDIMTKNVVTVGEGESIRKVVELMTGNGINRIPVVDGHGALVGMIARDDIIEALAKQFRGGRQGA